MIDLKQGDCLELMKEIPDKSVDAIITDPPYEYLKHKLDRPFDEQAVFNEWDRIVKDDGFLVFFGRGASFHRWNYLLNEMGWKFKEEIVWNKRYSSTPLIPISRMHETVSLLSKKGKIKKHKVPYAEMKQFQPDRLLKELSMIRSKLNNPKLFAEIEKLINEGVETRIYKQKTKHELSTAPGSMNLNRGATAVKSIIKGMNEQSIIEVKRDGRKSLVHPTQKPVRLMERLLFCATDEGEIILDPFMGSGSTGVACVNTKRDFIGMELDEEYFHIAEKRIQEAQSEIRLDV